MVEEFCEEYASSLNDLTCNSKPHISMLTMLAEENSEFAPNIVRLIEQHLQKVRPEIKLPAIYLIDSIVKNAKGKYLSLFTQNLVSTFCSVFEKVDEKTRLQLYKLRQTWVDVFPNKKLYAIDVRVHQMDPAWPISAPTANQSIHVNPKFLKSPKEVETAPVNVKANQEIEEAEMRRQLIAKQQELLKLQQQKLELELLQAKARLDEQKRLLQTQQTEVEQTVPETSKLFDANKPLVTTSSNSSTFSQIQTNSVAPKDPLAMKGPRTAKDAKPFRIPNLSSAVTKPINNFVSSKPVDTEIKSEVKDIMMKHERNMSDMAAGTFFAKQTLENARNDTTKGLKKKDGELPNKVSSKKKTEREWKKGELKKVTDVQTSPNKKSDAKRKEKEKKGKKDPRDPSKPRKAERKNVGNVKVSKKEHDATKKSDGVGRRTNIRSRRNYRSNRDRSESPELKAENTTGSPKPDEQGRKYKKKLLGAGDGVGDKKMAPVDELKENKMDVSDISLTDIDLRLIKGKREVGPDAEEPPPNKRIRRDDEKDARMNNLFGSKDQDYRQICQKNDRNSWAQYKAEHPDEFKNTPPTPGRGPRPDFMPYRSYDMDLRNTGARDFDTDCSMIESNLMNAPGPGPSMRGGRGRSNDPRLARRGFGRPMRQGNGNNRVFEDARNLRRHPLYERYESEFENSHPTIEIPNALHLDRQGEIMRQADQQLKSGLLSPEQYSELLNQLAKLYELQVTRKRQRVDQFRERIMPNRTSTDEFPPDNSFGAANRPDRSAQAEVAAPEVRPEPEPETGTRTKVSMLSIFQRENAPSAGSDNVNPNRVAVAADDGDRLIAIDGRIMKLKYHNGTAIILEGTKVQEILFRGTRREIFVDREIVLLGFEGDEQTFFVSGKPHTLKFGTPTHEIYVDSIPYEARFGGPAIKVMLDGDVHEIRMGGPPPDVELKELSADMKAQIAHLIEDAQENGPSSLPSENTDVEKEKERTNDQEENHQSVPMDIEELTEEDGSIVTTNLDEKIEVEKEKEKEKETENVSEDKNLANEERFEGRSQPWEKEREPHRGYEKENFSDQFSGHDYREKGRDKWREREKPMRNVREYNTGRQMDEREEYWPRREDEFGRRPKYYNNRERGGRNASPQRGMNEYGRFRDGPRRNFNPMYFAEGPRMRYDGARAPYDNRPRGYDVHPRFDMRARTDLRHPGVRQQLPGQYYGANQFNFYPDDPNFRPKNANSTSDANPAAQPSILPIAGPSQAAAPSLDVSELFQKLVANGIIPSMVSTAIDLVVEAKKSVEVSDETQSTVIEEEEYMEEYDEKVPIIEFTSESLRTRYPGVIGKLCRGIQCSSCGLRFTSEQTEKYAQHLDWHFRQNRRERDSAKKAMSRKWYYDVQDWIQFEEIEDMEERARSLFEEQAIEDQSEQTDDVQTIPVAENEADNVCAVCGESFEQFWDQDKEEWHLRDATRIDGKTYHPICYEDIRNISQSDSMTEEVKEEPKHIVADSWKSLEEKMEQKVVVKEEKDTDLLANEESLDNLEPQVPMETVSIKEEIESPPPSEDVKTEEVLESLTPTSGPVDAQDDGMVEYVPPKLPGFTILPPVTRGTELSGLCSIM